MYSQFTATEILLRIALAMLLVCDCYICWRFATELDPHAAAMSVFFVAISYLVVAAAFNILAIKIKELANEN